MQVYCKVGSICTADLACGRNVRAVDMEEGLVMPVVCGCEIWM